MPFFIYNHENELRQAEEKRMELIQLKKLGPEFSEKHPGAIYTSRLLSSMISNSNSSSMISFNKFNNIKQGMYFYYRQNIN